MKEEADQYHEPEQKAAVLKFPRRPPSKRRSVTYKLNIGGNKVFLNTGLYADGSLCEVFVDLHKAGSAARSLMNCLAIAVSLGLQYGVPLKTFVSFFSHTRFEPSGIVSGYKGIKHASSIVDCIFRVLGKEFINKESYNDPEDEFS
jgi:ribonucleoside-diphosphate reductase alpha chain